MACLPISPPGRILNCRFQMSDIRRQIRLHARMRSTSHI